MNAEQRSLAVADTIGRHIDELRTMAADKRITVDDHDTVGLILCRDIGMLIGLTNEAWQKFKQIVDESREVHYRE
jgi:hypothetical protein